MTDDNEPPSMFPSAVTEAMQRAGSDAKATQEQLTETMFEASSPEELPLDAVQGTATFKTRIQSGGRISIPDAEREILDLGESDIVQAVIAPLKRTQNND
jgi:hypothetical protein